MLACTLCHNRKVRCEVDVDSNTCVACKAAGVGCIPRARKKRRVGAAATDDQQQQQPYHNGSHSHSIQHGQDTSQSSTTGMIVPMENAASQTPSTSQGTTYIGRGHYVASEDEIDETNARAFEPAKVGPHASTQKATMDLWKAFDIPPPAARQSLLSAFLDYCNLWTPVLEPHDIRGLSCFDPEKTSMLLAQSLWLAGSRVTNAPSVVAFASSDDFYYRAKAVFWSGVETDGLSAIKASLMLQWYNPQAPEHISFDNSGFWLKLGVGIAHQIGLHKEYPPGPSQAIRRRLWWSLVARDSLISVAHGRPRVINLDDSDVQDPIPSDFPDSLFAFQLFSAWVGICQILGDISTCCIRRHMSRTKRLYIVNSLCRWTTILPQELLVAPNNQPPHNYYANSHNLPARQLYLPYFTSLIVLSRMQHSAGSLSLTATLAASFVARIFEDFLARDEIKVLAPISTRYCLISSMALVSVMPNEQLWEAAQPDLEVLQLALTELSKRWRSAIGASRALQNAIRKRRQRTTSSTTNLRMDDRNSLEFFKMVNLSYCRMWNTISQQMPSTSPLATQGQEQQMPMPMPMPMQPPSSTLVDTGPFMEQPGDAWAGASAFQFEHVENWILNDGFLFEP